MAAPALQAVGLRKTYVAGRRTDPVVALDGLDLEANRGSILGLLGPNGAGKSTTVKILATLTRADSGSALVDGVDVSDRPEEVRRRIGLVSQRPSSDPMATGWENLVLAGRLHGLARQEAEDRSAALLGRLDLSAAADRLVKTWSGGMSRKLDVAIGLAHRPTVLFLDEPTTGLDPEARAELWSEITRLTQEDETTVLLTTHYLDEADKLADQVAIVDHGQIKVHGTPEELKSALRGDAVVFELTAGSDAGMAVDRLRSLAGLGEVSIEGSTLRARADLGARAVPLALAALEEIGVEVASATMARPSLDDVYLRHVGRAFEAVA